MDSIQTMPNNEAMIKGKYSVRDFLNYYRNIWLRNLAARLTDVATDTVLKAKNPDNNVQSDDGSPMPVKIRLEHRKILVQDAVNLIENIDSLLARDDESLASTYSKDALKVAEDMIPKPEEKSAPADEPAKPAEENPAPSPEAKV